MDERAILATTALDMAYRRAKLVGAAPTVNELVDQAATIYTWLIGSA